MQAVRISSKAENGFELAEVPPPSLGPTSVRIRVQAVGLNRADVLQLKGLYPAPPGAPPDLLGLEYAGQITECGAQTSRWRVGDRVMGIVAGGAFAQEVVVDAREVLPIPASLSTEEAAAVPEAFLTAFDALILQGGLQPGDTVLIHAVASGVGTAALQCVRAFGGRALGTSRSAAKLEQCHQAFGGDRDDALLCAEGPRFAKEVLARTSGRGVSLALELVGGSYLAETMAAMAERGRIVLVGLLAGAQAQLPLGLWVSRRLNISGTVLRSRSLEEKIALVQRFEARAWPLLAAGTLRPVVGQRRKMSVAGLADALKEIAANRTFGKSVITWEENS